MNKPKSTRRPASDAGLITMEKPAVMLPPIAPPVLSVLEGYTLRELRAIRDALNKLFEFV